MAGSCFEKNRKRLQRILQPLDFLSALAGTRTLGPMIKSHLLYQLSYESLSRKGVQKYMFFLEKPRSCLNLFVSAIGRGFGGMARRFSKEDSPAIGREKGKR